MKEWKNRDVISAKDFSKKEFLFLFDVAKKFKQNKLKANVGKTVTLLFFEPSTRTYNSFRMAAHKIGCFTDGFASAQTTSVVKGESTFDTLKMFTGYGTDCFVIRHPKAGIHRYLAERFDVPIINAGDDSHEHPTQAMLDVFTIWENFGKIDGLKIGIMGDLRYGRTPSSLSYVLSNWKVKLYFIAPELLQIEKRLDNMEFFLQKKGVDYEKISNYKDVLNELDVLYVTRIQKERFPDLTEYEKVKGSYVITSKDLKGVKKHFIVMHPLPRVNEIDTSVDNTPHAKYFEQAKNGLYVRMALLYLILGGSDEK
ncbi:MAG: aspartate carbamoyltransferase [Candidatus Aenigmarchaeota archaeon]|nr:aspartate carbamoyltransferase [Candidatus Aenigmarchaeota archaeon]